MMDIKTVQQALRDFTMTNHKQPTMVLMTPKDFRDLKADYKYRHYFGCVSENDSCDFKIFGLEGFIVQNPYFPLTIV